MILCLDVGNSLIHGGLFDGFDLKLQFRRPTQATFSSDELGVFLRVVLRENGFDPASVKQLAVCTVVPALIHSIRNCGLKYFDHKPFFLQAGVKTGLRIKYHNPVEVGSDRIANAIAASSLFPDRDLIIADLGTATTLDAVTAKKEYLGGTIYTGLKIAAEALEERTAQLPSVALEKPERIVGKSTQQCIQSGLYYGTVGMLKELTARVTAEAFPNSQPLIIGTSGLANLFEEEGLFDELVPDLVLKGLRLALHKN